MSRTALLICALAILAAPAGAAQLYRWIDEKGNVEWRDTPPPSTAKKVEQRTIGVSSVPGSDLPFAVQQAMKNFPVTLWTTSDCGDLCERARGHLNRRGVPYTDKDALSDLEGFKKVSGATPQIPLLFVGANRLTGYLASEWDAALDVAGYPQTALVPAKPQPKPVAAAKPGPTGAPPSTVKLYSGLECPPCDAAKQFLMRRGVKFEEILTDTPAALEELRKLSGDTLLPTLHAGRFVFRGFDVADYNRILDEAGFAREQAAVKP